MKDWLDNLPKWDGVERLDTHMAVMGFTIKYTLDSGKEVDFTSVAQALSQVNI